MFNYRYLDLVQKAVRILDAGYAFIKLVSYFEQDFAFCHSKRSLAGLCPL